jgi:hypothetical protein
MVLPGLSLPLLLSRPGLEDDDDTEEREETEARLRVAALARIEALKGEECVSEDSVEQMRDLYEFRRQRLSSWLADQAEDGYEQTLHGIQTFQARVVGSRTGSSAPAQKRRSHQR